jgi:predicted Fe-Mo cluster-binding NifX family protein
MILIPLKKDEKTISPKFRKADRFVFLDADSGIVVEDNHFKDAKSKEFFDYFKTLNVDKIFLKGLGIKTFENLNKLGVEVYLIKDDVDLYSHIDISKCIKITSDNASEFCVLGHKKDK